MSIACHCCTYDHSKARLSPFDGGCTSLILPWVDTQTMMLFLRHTAQEFADSVCLMLLIGAGWHHAQDLVLPDRLRLLFLPPYQPVDWLRAQLAR